MPGHDSGFAARVKAVLGPTNTGKTHLAIERLLAHSSGIIGFPLRLLARENYDRMVAKKGARHVALITGEEKIIPPEARWFSCTVEAMPLDRQAEFVAVDEIQLCADPDRGHVFTDRLLHARGMVETMFLGAETIRPLLQRLVPNAHVETRPRLSQLSYAGPVKLARLPPRSAVVAFSAADVYAIAELIRRRKGGCAVVMGRLSPRTRNAQVALYQEREVDFLVATDAIGMGLNMSVDHVAFAGLGKFDGRRPRRLTPAEIGQIAGRAGRGMRDGTFGTTTQCPPIPEDVVAAVESHTFEPLPQLFWRNSDLDFSGVDPLLDSLGAAPTRPDLIRGNDASDLETLTSLARETEIRQLARGRRMVRLLWEACQIPDFRKLSDETHARLCARVFQHVAREGQLPTDWIGGQIAALDRQDGDIDTLMQRLSGVRIWSYIAARSDWVADSTHWQGLAREVEDKLSDTLHDRLITRFVDRRAAHLMRRLEGGEGQELLSAVTRRGDIVVEGVGFAYGDGAPVLQGVDLIVADGERLALVGPTGAGKSTLAKLIARLYDPTEGRVRFAGVDLRRATLGSLRQRIVLMPQEGFLFAGSLRDNVRIGRPDATDAEVEAALARLGILERFERLEDGLDTEVRERGSRLSAGEKQLVSLARAALVDPPVLILDEATSSLDPGTEVEVEAALERLSHGRTDIVIAHRLSSAARADRVAVVAGGRLVEVGSHAELVAAGGHYSGLYAAWLAGVGGAYGGEASGGPVA